MTTPLEVVVLPSAETHTFAAGPCRGPLSSLPVLRTGLQEINDEDDVLLVHAPTPKARLLQRSRSAGAANRAQKAKPQKT